MIVIPPIPLYLLPSSCTVRVPKDGEYGGEYEEPVEIKNVRFDAASKLLRRNYVFTDGTQGLVFIDVVMSEGAFDIPEGSLMSIDGKPEMAVVKVEPYAPYGELHHWELEVK